LIGAPELTKIIIDEQELRNGHLLIHFEFASPFELSPPIIGILVKDSIGHPIFTTNARIHTKGFNKDFSGKSGKIILEVKDIPLFSGSYFLSCYLGDNSQDYNTYIDILQFYIYSDKVDNTKIPDTQYVGSVNMYSSKWIIQEHSTKL
jgi:hypothetical protein